MSTIKRNVKNIITKEDSVNVEHIFKICNALKVDNEIIKYLYDIG